MRGRHNSYYRKLLCALKNMSKPQTKKHIKLNLDKLFKSALILGITVVSISIAYYFVFYIPKRDRLNYENEKAKIDLQQKEKEAKQRELESNQKQLETNKTLSEACLQNAEKTYLSNWASTCVSNAERVQAGYNSCVETGVLASTCTSIWGKVDSSPNCSLPTNTASNIEAGRISALDLCFKRYPSE